MTGITGNRGMIITLLFPPFLHLYLDHRHRIIPNIRVHTLSDLDHIASQCRGTRTPDRGIISNNKGAIIKPHLLLRSKVDGVLLLPLNSNTGA